MNVGVENTHLGPKGVGKQPEAGEKKKKELRESVKDMRTTNPPIIGQHKASTVARPSLKRKAMGDTNNADYVHMSVPINP